MRIAEVASTASAVLREGSESIEQVVWTLAQGLTRRGHDVTVFGLAGSEGPGDVVTTLPGLYGDPLVPDDWRVCEWVSVARAVERSSQFDLIHSHSYLYGLPIEAMSHAPMVHTLHVMATDESAALCRLYPDAHVTALSRFQWAEFPDVRPGFLVPHGVNPNDFEFHSSPGDHAAFLGRFLPGKGAVAAIETARSLGVEIRLAGAENEYFRTDVAPRVDGSTVRYEGVVAGATRSAFLGSARVLLYPIDEPEPFGLVIVEAMMCGTPVAAYALGAVPEIVDDGVTGCLVEPGGDLARAAADAMRLDRRRVRAHAERRFLSEDMVDSYEAVFRCVLGSASCRVAAGSA